VSYEVKAEPAVNEDVAELAAEDRDAAREALRLMLDRDHEDPARRLLPTT